MKNSTVKLILAAILVLAPLGAFAADLKIGVVDGMDIIAKSAEGQRVQDNVRRKAEELGSLLLQERQDLSKQMEEFQKQTSKMKEAGRQKKVEELEKKLRDYERQSSDTEKQLRDFQEKEMAPLLQKLEAAVKAVAQENKLIMVLDKRNSGLLYMAPEMDITTKVRSKFGN